MMAASCNWLLSCIVSLLTCVCTRVDNTYVEPYDRHARDSVDLAHVSPVILVAKSRVASVLFTKVSCHPSHNMNLGTFVDSGRPIHIGMGGNV